MQRPITLFIIATLICCLSCNNKKQTQTITTPNTATTTIVTTNRTQLSSNESEDTIVTYKEIERDTHGLLKQTLKMDWHVESDTAFDLFECNIGDYYLQVFLQYLEDSSIKGYYRFSKNNKKILITGKKFKDSISLFELDSSSSLINISKLILKNDSAYGNWFDLKNKVNYQIILIRTNWSSGDLENYNYQNNTLVFRQDNQIFRIPISKYFNHKYNYVYFPLLTEKKNEYFYTLVRFYYKSLNKNEKGRDGWGPYSDFLMFAKFNNKGVLIKDQVLKIDSEHENITVNGTYGSLFDVMRDSLNIDVFYLNDNYKYNVSIDRKNIDKGLIIKKVKTNIAKYIYDSLTLNLDKEYQLVIKFKLSTLESENDQRYSYYSVSEKNKKDIKPLSDFCKDLNRYTLVYINNKISRPFNGDEYNTLDCNFDGYKDIFIRDGFASGNNNPVVRIWTYNIKRKKYELNNFLSSLSIYGVNKNNQTLSTVWDMGYNDRGTSIYKKINGKIRLFESENRRSNKKNKTVTVTKGNLIKGKWVETKTIEKN